MKRFSAPNMDMMIGCDVDELVGGVLRMGVVGVEVWLLVMWRF
jgi:hypothetical protein